MRLITAARLPLTLAVAIALAGCYTMVAPPGPLAGPPGQTREAPPGATGGQPQPLTPANTAKPSEADDALWTLRGKAVLPGGKPLARAEVRLYDADTGTMIGASPLDPVTSTLMEGDPFTYPDGTWHMAFRPLPQGRVYRVVARTERHTLMTLVSADGRALAGANGQDPLAGYRLQAGGRKAANPIRVETVAGTGAEGSKNGAYGEATFKDPQGIAVAPNGTIYVADTGNHVVRALARGEVTTMAGTGMAGDATGPATTAGFRDPHGLALDASGSTVYVADTGNKRVQAIADGQVTTVALATAAPVPTPPTSTATPTPDAATPTPRPAASPPSCSRTGAYNVFGVIKACATNPYAPPPRRPPAKKKYEVAEETTTGSRDESLLGFSLTTATVAPAPLPDGFAPTGVAAQAGGIVVVSPEQPAVRVDLARREAVASVGVRAKAVAGHPGTGTVLLAARAGGTTVVHDVATEAWPPPGANPPRAVTGNSLGESLNGLEGLCVAPDGTTYVATGQSHTIGSFSLPGAGAVAGQLRTLVGGAGRGYKDGDAGDAQLDGPAGICLDGEGNVLFTETGNDVVRKLVLWEPAVPEVVLDVTTTTGTVLLDSGRLTYALNDDFEAMFQQATAEQRNAINATLRSLREALNRVPANAATDAVDAALFNADGSVASGATFTQRLSNLSGALKDPFKALGAYLVVIYERKAGVPTSGSPGDGGAAAQVPFILELTGDGPSPGGAGGGRSSGRSGGSGSGGGSTYSPPPPPPPSPLSPPSPPAVPVTSGLYTLFTGNASDTSAGTRLETALQDKSGSGAYDVAVDAVGSAFVSCRSLVAEVTGGAFATVKTNAPGVTFQRLAWGGEPGLFYGAVDGPSVLDASTVLVNIDSGATLAVSGSVRSLNLFSPNSSRLVFYVDNKVGLVIVEADLLDPGPGPYVHPDRVTDVTRSPNDGTFFATEVEPTQDVIRVVKSANGTATVTVIPNPNDQPSYIEVHGDWLYVSRTKGAPGGPYASTIYRVKTDGTASSVVAGGDSNATFLSATDDNTMPTQGRIGAVSGMAIAPDGKALYITEFSEPQGDDTYGRVRKLDLL